MFAVWALAWMQPDRCKHGVSELQFAQDALRRLVLVALQSPASPAHQGSFAEPAFWFCGGA